MASRTNTPFVYAAHPMTSYGTPRETAYLAVLARLLPDAEIVNPSARYTTDAGWRRSWPRVLATLSGLVVFADDGGTVGTGCLQEITDAILTGLPIAFLDHDCRLCELAGLDLVDAPERSRRHAARPRGGAVLTEAAQSLALPGRQNRKRAAHAHV